jgi:hypothetical protein
MVDSIKEIGVRIRCTGKEFLLGHQVKYMRDSITRIRSMVLENLRKRMGLIMRVIGCLDSVMVVGL